MQILREIQICVGSYGRTRVLRIPQTTKTHSHRAAARKQAKSNKKHIDTERQQENKQTQIRIQTHIET